MSVSFQSTVILTEFNQATGVYNQYTLVLVPSSSSGSVPFRQGSCLHDSLPFTSILRTLPRRIEDNFASADVLFDCAKSSPPRSTGSATPLGWRTVDGCPKST